MVDLKADKTAALLVDCWAHCLVVRMVAWKDESLVDRTAEPLVATLVVKMGLRWVDSLAEQRGAPLVGCWDELMAEKLAGWRAVHWAGLSAATWVDNLEMRKVAQLVDSLVEQKVR